MNGDSESIDERFLEEILACPRCRRQLARPRCVCGAAYARVDGVWRLLPGEDQSIAQTFYNEADLHRHGSGRVPPDIAHLVRDFLSKLDRDDVVVELGSGRCLFAGWHPRLVLTDLGFHVLSEFGAGSPRVQLDAQRLPFRDASVDAFFSIAMIEHVPQPELVLAEIDRCLAPGGRALLFPAWLVFPWAAKDLARRPYHELSPRDKISKLLIPVRRSAAYRFATVLPSRIARETKLKRGRALPFTYRRLSPTLDRYLTSDSDAFTNMDPHACAAYFLSRGYRVFGAEGFWSRLTVRYVPIAVRKAPACPDDPG